MCTFLYPCLPNLTFDLYFELYFEVRARTYTPTLYVVKSIGSF